MDTHYVDSGPLEHLCFYKTAAGWEPMHHYAELQSQSTDTKNVVPVRWDDLSLHPQTMFGSPVVIVPDVPKMQLSKEVYDELPSPFRDEFNQWMRGFFGTTNPCPDGQIHKIGLYVHMNPRTYAECSSMNLLNRFYTSTSIAG